MYKEIEKNYKNQLSETEFKRIYWISAFFIILIYNILKIVFNFKNRYYFIIYICLIISIIFYYIVDFMKKSKNYKGNIRSKIKYYIFDKKRAPKKELLKLLKKYGFKSKADLKILIDYYQNNRSLKIESSFLSWIVSASITIASFVEIAYDSSTNKINYEKLYMILGTTLGIIITTLIIFITIKLIYHEIFSTKENIQMQINEDLVDIYINYNKYK